MVDDDVVCERRYVQWLLWHSGQGLNKVWLFCCGTERMFLELLLEFKCVGEFNRREISLHVIKTDSPLFEIDSRMGMKLNNSY